MGCIVLKFGQVGLGSAAGVLLVFAATAAWTSEPPPVPDLTREKPPLRQHDYNLGPTGARGWIWGWKLSTANARQILITQVESGSPADGLLEPGDVLLGLNGVPFATDARRAFGEAITEAEREENEGRLRLLRWRRGSTDDLVLRLRPLGTYSSSAPRDCPKTARIVAGACRHLAGTRLQNDTPGQINALGLLATGRPEHHAQVARLAREIGPADLSLKLVPGMVAWPWGTANLLLTEYHLATGDASVLPAIREYSTKIAEGQSSVGTWGHGMLLPGSTRGLGGYGAVNQAGLGCWLSLILAEKCGVEDAAVRRAIERSRRFFSFFIGKGSIPYGDHGPYHLLHDNNGKNGQAAIAFDLLQDDVGRRFFSRMATAAYAERELGHTGNYFGYLWGPLGAARAGLEAVAAHLEPQRWFYDLARRWDGSFRYQEAPGAEDSYSEWDTTGIFLLTASLPQKALLITGRESKPADELVGRELARVIDDGGDFDPWHEHDCLAGKETEELLERLGSWSPAVRYRAARGLAGKPDDVVPRLVRMLGDEDINRRLGACQALEWLGPRGSTAVDPLIAQLSENDEGLRIRAANALAGIGKPARRAVPTLVRIAIEGQPEAARQTTRRSIGIALFLSGFSDIGPKRGLLADSIEDVDRPMLVPLIRQLLEADDGFVRSQVASVYPKLTAEELRTLWPDILRAVEQSAPSGEMFANGVRIAGLRLLADHHIREGMRTCLEYARTQEPWASEERMGEIMDVLVSYGTAAREMLPELRQLAEDCRNELDFPAGPRKRKTEAVEKAIREIEAARDQPRLRSLEEVL